MKLLTKKTFAVTTVLLLIVAVLGFAVACSDNKKQEDTSYSLSYTEKDDYVEAVLPYYSVSVSSNAFTLMQITKVSIKITLTSDTDYVYFVEDITNPDTADLMHFRRTYSFKGKYVKNADGTYAFTKATSYEKVLVMNTKFAESSYGTFGAAGTFTEATDDKGNQLTNFTDFKGTVSGNDITLSLAS